MLLRDRLDSATVKIDAHLERIEVTSWIPRSKALAGLMKDVSALEDTLEGFEQELQSFESLNSGGPEQEQEQAYSGEQLALLRETVAELRQELSQKRSRLQELSDGNTGCVRRNINPFDRERIENTSED